MRIFTLVILNTICSISANYVCIMNSWYWLRVIFPVRTDCCFSPDDKLLVTGTSVKKDEGNGKLVFFDRASFQRGYEIEVTNAVSSASVSTIIARCFFQLVDMMKWLQTKMSQIDAKWKGNEMSHNET